MTDPSSDVIQIENQGPVRFIFLNRPEVRNAINVRTLLALRKAVRDAEQTQEGDTIRDAQSEGQVSQRFGMVEPGARRPTDDDQPDVAGQLSQRLDRDVRPLVRLESSGEEHETLFRANAQQLPGGGAAAGNEHPVVHARMDNINTLRVSPIQRDELVKLVRGVGNEPIGKPGDLGLGDDPRPWFGTVADGEVEVLDAAHGVHAVDERDTATFPDDQADLARQPVVAVHEVVRLGRGHHACADAAGHDRAHAHTRLDLGVGRLTIARVNTSTATPRRASCLAVSRT